MSDPSLTQIIHYTELPVDGFPRLGTGGQPTEEQLASVKAAGFETVINLALPTSTGALPDEAGLVNGLGMEYVPIPVVWEEPKAEDLQQFFAALQARKGKKVFVHCAMNFRASAFMYLYRVKIAGVPEEDARWDMLSIWVPFGAWKELIKGEMGIEL